jgi:hypothetical protein
LLSSTYSEKAITDEDARKGAKEIELNEKVKLEGRLSQPRGKPKDYKNELGLWTLAINQTNKRIIMDCRGTMTDMLGYDPSEPMSYTEFVARQARLEKESVEEAKADGKHPNPKLCHMCRLVKPLSPTTEKANGRLGFEWEPEYWFLPFGTWRS